MQAGGIGRISISRSASSFCQPSRPVGRRPEYCARAPRTRRHHDGAPLCASVARPPGYGGRKGCPIACAVAFMPRPTWTPARTSPPRRHPAMIARMARSMDAPIADSCRVCEDGLLGGAPSLPRHGSPKPARLRCETAIASLAFGLRVTELPERFGHAECQSGPNSLRKT